MLNRLFPSIPQSITVFLFWWLMSERTSPGTLLMGGFLAWLMPQIAARLEREFARIGEAWILVPLGIKLFWDVIVANVTVARQVLGREEDLTPGFIWIPLELTNIHGISALTSVITITPGTLTAELSEDRSHLLVHCLDVPDPEGMVRLIKERYEAPLRRVFP
ncbi:Na+/H+ antiporter subunit E [Luteimonas wenzhouensis]|jgi:multicomponent K+:H+ antiporter subunit E|uniref:Na+/H+ antiporter subunit E n=1 Tax=Luteimonas wenzhouensis TaxID=2599615 RepID=A0A5C5TUN6_9GAMM|nr:Na+/H+ antiporter subunit E [Luteimonas wenzhouensis]NLW97151.1 Na+/H+ antiporter subunit E [Xanthomonadaceae bacterium]TWT16900.1 Na+/H+ antiporter subunit E [Luteimonas wenzhouensis]